jgi:hypothetical protein
MDSVGVVSLAIDVSKDLYTYYRAVRDCDTDIKELRTQLLLLHETASSLTRALNRDGLSAEDKSQMDLAFIKYDDAAKELKSGLERIKIDGVQPHTALEKMKAVGRKAVYPFKKSTVAGLQEDVESCQDALHLAVSILQLNIGATTVEQFQKLDDKLVSSTTAIESGLRDLGLAHDAAKDEIVRHVLQNRKMLEEEGNRRKAMAIVESLEYSQMTNRQWQVRTAEDSSLGGLFVGEESQRHPQIQSLLSFLEGRSGMFWIQGKPASGKSTFMKYLLSRLWITSNSRDAVFVSHFCWIAGTTMQKSQQGLLQSLLHQILQSDLALVPVACLSQWKSGSSITQWYEKELWACLYAAVQASDKQICFFIDGLDELEPEREHVLVSKALNELSSYRNSKVVVSSRPWTTFERNLKHDGKVLTMEDNNERAIIGYIRNELETGSTDKVFDQVSWDCIYEKSYECRSTHHHGEAHDLARDIATRANGVFLWVTLVMEAVCRHVALGCPVSVLRSYVDRLPSELFDYFRDMIFKRIHESMLSETAMAISLALMRNNRLIYFTLLCNYQDSGISWLADPRFVSDMPFTTITPDELDDIVCNTTTFIRVCGKDILQCKMTRECGSHEFLTHESVSFVHRTVWDYLHTPEMELLLDKHTPGHFKDALFHSGMAVATCKTVVLDPRDAITGWKELSDSVYPLSWWQELDDTVDEIHHGRQGYKLAQILEKACLFHLRAIVGILTAAPYKSHHSIRASCTQLCVDLALYGLFTFTDALIDVAPQVLGSVMEIVVFINGTLLDNDSHESAFDIGRLQRLLQSGVNLNRDYWGRVGSAQTLWRLFFGYLRVDTYIFLPLGKQLVVVPRRAGHGWSNIGALANIEEVFEDSHAQDAIRVFIELGADLTPEDVAILTRYLPKSTDNTFDWPEFLTTYSQPAKRNELEESRRERLRRWPENWLTEDDRKLIHGDSQAVRREVTSEVNSD